jgi:hypothetical protein
VVEVTVTEQTPGTYVVTTEDGARSTTHTVLVGPEVPRRLGCAQLPVTELVRLSFDFLLAREPATSILGRFRLEQIGDYFPEYPDEIRTLAKGKANEPPIK